MKLDLKNENHFFLNKKKSFKPTAIDKEIVKKVFDFAYEMIFGAGFHRNKRSGGEHNRKKGELFANTFQGKLAEFVIYHELKNNNFTDIKEPDIAIHGKGIWDDADLEYKEKKINIKSAVFFSNLLLLESKDWDENGEYVPNIKSTSSQKYDYFIMVRIKPDIKGMFKKEKIFYSESISKHRLENIILTNTWLYDFAGYCSLETIKYIIKNKYILPQNSMLNGKIKMDASNYYVQTGDLKDFSCFMKDLRSF